MAILVFNLFSIVIVILTAMALAMFGPAVCRRAWRAHPRLTGTAIVLFATVLLCGALFFERLPPQCHMIALRVICAPLGATRN